MHDLVRGDHGDHGVRVTAASTAAGQAMALSESRPSGSPRMLAGSSSGSSAATTFA